MVGVAQALVKAFGAGSAVLCTAAGFPCILAGFAADLGFGLGPNERGETFGHTCRFDKVVGHIDKKLKGETKAIFHQSRGEKNRLSGPKR